MSNLRASHFAQSQARPVAKPMVRKADALSRKFDFNEGAGLLKAITNRKTLKEVAAFLGIRKESVEHWSREPTRFSPQWAQDRIILPLMEAFPGKTLEIGRLMAINAEERMSASSIKEKLKAAPIDPRIVTGQILREWREAAGLSVEALGAQIKSPIVQRNLSRAEAGALIALSIYRETATAVDRVLTPLMPSIAPHYAAKLGQQKKWLAR